MTGERPLRVCYLKQRFDPEPAPLRGAAFTADMRERGIDLTVLTGFPYYPLTSVHDGYRQRRHQVERIDGTEVHRSVSVVGHSASPLRRAASYVSMPAMSVVNAITNKLEADLVLTTLGPAPYAHFSLLLAKRLGVPCVFEVQDLWPESLIASGMWPSWAPVGAVHAATRLAYKHASAITALSAGCRDALVDRGANPATTVTMLNWAPPVSVTEADHHQAEQLLGDWAGHPFIAYAGTVGPLQGVDRMFSAAERAGARLVVVGSGRSASTIEAEAARAPDTIRFVGQQTPGVARAILARSAATTVYLEQSVLGESAIPSKFASNLLAGVPMVVAAEGETGRMAERVDAGPLCVPGDTGVLAASYERVLTASAQQREQWTQNATIFAKEWTQTETGLDRYAAFLRTVACGGDLTGSVDADGFLV